MDFIAIDFETANSKLSPCAVGLIVVENNKINEELYSLINPEQPISRNNTKIHGITDSDVKESPLFPEVWARIACYFKRFPIVAHNAGFDKKVFEKAMRRYKLDNTLPMVYYCTMALYRYNYPQAQKSDLPSACAALDVPLDNYHNALSDAKATAQAMIAMHSNVNNSIFPSFVSGFHLDTKEREEAKLAENMERAKETRPRPFISEHVPEFTPTTATMDSITEITFDDCTFVLTGKVGNYERLELEGLIKERGGRVVRSVSKKVNYVVVGLQDVSVVKDSVGAKSRKILDAEALRDSGYGIKIIDASVFLAAL